MRSVLAILCVLTLSAPGLAQDKKKGAAADKVDPVKVDAAIKKGLAYLKTQLGRFGTLNKRRSDELILWTFTHGGIAENDPDFEKLLKNVLETPLEWTYNVSLQAMILEELDRVKYQGRIAQCAQFLVDNQCQNGQWSYGEVDQFAKDVPTGTGKKAVASGPKAKPEKNPPGTRVKPKVLNTITIKQMKKGPVKGDNSNSQYASLGLRACHDAGVVLPAEVLELGEKWWRDGLGGDGWGYLSKNDTGYGSMTAGAVGALTIYLFIQGKPWLKDKEVTTGMDWLAKNFTVTQNPGPHDADGGQGGWQYYFLYALERAGIFFGTETMGAHEWYVEGAQYLLGQQKDDGSWMSKGADHAIWDTCFAILFLRRATRPLRDVASEDRKMK
ncbi:MAG: hypothetical protein HY293_22795 [Planctomycetes bacterium]|nr:hypothetical protein [Planctomycetota bacterium]